MLRKIVFSLIIFAVLFAGIASAVTFEPDFNESYSNYFYISEIETPEKVDTWSFDVNLYLKGVGWSGSVTITPESDLPISPSSTNRAVYEDQDNVIRFNVQAGDMVGMHTIKFEACSHSQFTSDIYCDEEQVSVYVEESSKPFPWSWVILFGIIFLIIITAALTIKSNKKKK